MSKKPPDLFNFWNELKRRKVVRASMVYLAAAFAIMQAADMIFPKLGLPEWTVTFVIILLLIVFILIIILTWVYDITPEGIKVTRTFEPDEKEKDSEPEQKVSESGEKSAVAAEQADLQKKVQDLEMQLAEAEKISLKKAVPMLLGKIAVPLFIIIALILLLVYKQKIIEILGFGDKKREIAMTHNFNATLFINSGDLASASREVDLALENDPGYSYAWSNKGVISYLQGDLGKAVNEITKAISLDSKNSKGPYNLAFALDDKKDYKHAIQWYREAIRIDSTFNVDSVYAAASSSLGRLYNSLDDPINAIIVLTRAKSRFPDSKNISYIYKNLGNAYLLQQQTDSALKYLELSFRLNPSEPETNLFLARAYEASGDLTGSIEQWQKYIDLETDTAKINTAVKHRKELAVRQLQEIIK